ncbi:MAG TPA: MBL fold metallo-hydrolase [Caulobacteraceae bacterium]|nr:MBL fold metallo-hydrolase [Caulobacteraceae bacterium]
MLIWKVGEVTIKRIVEMELPIPYDERVSFIRQATPAALRELPWLFPNYVADDGALKLSIHALLVEAPGMRLVVDTCIGNDRPRTITGNQALSTSFLSDLGAAGWARDSVDAVICTHLHVDHVGWNTMLEDGRWVPTFPKAKYLIGKQEYAFWSAHEDGEQQTILADSVKPVLDAGLAQLVEMDHVLSPEVRLQPTPGHTPGHVSVVIQSAGETALITGDAIHHPCQMAHPDWSPWFDSDGAAAAVTRKGILEQVADQPILFIGTHFAAPTAGRVVRDGDAYRLEA